MNRLRAFVPTQPEIRAVARWLWRPLHPRAVHRPDAPDSGLVDLLESPFTTVHETLKHLHEGEMRLRALDDRRAVFLTVYTRMTEQVKAELDDGGFADPDWVADYLVTFANQYRKAFVDYEHGDIAQVPAPWRVAFDAALTGDTLVLQDALLGVNAHINYDLTWTLHEVGIDPDRTVKKADHDHVNAILAELIDAVQDTLVDVYDALGVTSTDAVLGDLDEHLVRLGLTQGRDFAWANAVLLADLRVPITDSLVRWRLRTISLGAAHFIRRATLDDAQRANVRALEDDADTAVGFATELDRHVPRPRPGHGANSAASHTNT